MRGIEGSESGGGSVPISPVLLNPGEIAEWNPLGYRVIPVLKKSKM